MDRKECVRHCLEHDPVELMARYLDGKPDLSNDDREVLLFALYMESKQNKGLACRGVELLVHRGRREESKRP
jgi:hypothetical protein